MSRNKISRPSKRRRSSSRIRPKTRRIRSTRFERLEERINLAAASYDLGALIGSDGFVLEGIDAGDSSGISVSSAGDFNGDGFDANVLSVNFLVTLPAETADPTAAVSPVAPSLAGDVNADGRVDQYDLDLVALRFGAFNDGGATLADGDVTGDGRVDGLDINWLAVRLMQNDIRSNAAVNDLALAELFGGI